ncbi:MAG: metallophosphoesterase family protein [Actinobacteria bacterium]|nr:metallophosphoesterase family protein [Actinomycetota bacterium]
MTARFPRPATRTRLTRIATVAAVTAGLTIGSTALTAVTALAADDLPASFVTATSTWQYSDNNTDPAAGSTDRLVWTTTGFDDTAWKTGVGAFGAKYGAATGLGDSFPVTTLLNQYIDASAATKVDVPTFHFRTDVELTAGQLDQISGLTGTIVYDDAVQVFVNGTKVAGFVDDRVEAVDDSQKNLTYAGDSNGNPVTSTFTIPVETLTAGTNTIAVALYQDRASSSDIYLDLQSLVPATSTDAVTVSDLVLGVGSTESERNLSWYSSADTTQVAQVAPTSTLVDGVFPDSATTVVASGAATTSGEYNRFATLSGLNPDTEYSYRVGSDSGWSSTYTFATQSFDGDFTFLFFGDPQIGSSGNIASDTAGWSDTLDVALAANPDTELLISGGDQVEHAATEAEYDGFLTPDALRQVPLATTLGNHDVGSKAYEQHFNMPNVDTTAGAASSASASGGDYWYIYKDVLFVSLNTNSQDYSSHIAFLNQVVADHGADATWKVLTFHQSIYSSGPHADDGSIVDARANLPTAISEAGFDLVLQGHDHTYARSFGITDGELANTTEQAGAGSVVQGEGGVVYVTANSSSGSKYYNLDAADAWYLSAYNQERVRNYTSVEVTDEGLVVKTLRSEAYGTDSPVNSVVDQVTVLAAEDDGTDQTLEVAVPELPGEFTWTVDGSSDVVDLGTASIDGDHFTAAGSINPVVVSDTRAGSPQWSLSAQVSDFTAGSRVFSGSYLGWTPKIVTAGGGAVAGSPVAGALTGGAGLSESSTLGSAPATHVKGSASLGADLSLLLPLDTVDGTYQATLTLTALS